MHPFAIRQLGPGRRASHDESESKRDATASQPWLEEPRYTVDGQEEGSDGVSFTALVAQASLTWTELGELVPSPPDSVDYEHVEYGTKQLVFAPEIVERERRPYALNFHHLYTMIPTGRPKRFKICQFLYPINCSGDWARHKIDFMMYKKQKFSTVWEV